MHFVGIFASAQILIFRWNLYFYACGTACVKILSIKIKMNDDQFEVRSWCDQLSDTLVPHLSKGFRKLFQQSKSLNSKEPCKMFQLCLSRIPELPLSILDDDYKMLIRDGCDPKWLHHMIVGIFATYAKLNLVSHGAPRDIKIHKRDLEIPDNLTFVHKCYIEAARILFSTPYLFSDKFDKIKQDENAETVKIKIREGVSKTLMRHIPFQQLHYKYLRDMDQSGGASSGSEEAPVEPQSDEIESEGSPSVMSLNGTLNEEPFGSKVDEEKLDVDLNLRETFRNPEVNSDTSPEVPQGQTTRTRLDVPQEQFAARTRLCRENIRKLQQELEHPTDNTSNKSRLLDKLMNECPNSPIQATEPQSTFDLTLESKDHIIAQPEPVPESVPVPEPDSVPEPEPETLKETVPEPNSEPAQESAENGEGFKVNEQGEPAEKRVARVKRIIIKPEGALDLEEDFGGTDSGVIDSGFRTDHSGIADTGIPESKKEEYAEPNMAEVLGITGPTVIEIPLVAPTIPEDILINPTGVKEPVADQLISAQTDNADLSDSSASAGSEVSAPFSNAELKELSDELRTKATEEQVQTGGSPISDPVETQRDTVEKMLLALPDDEVVEIAQKLLALKKQEPMPVVPEPKVSYDPEAIKEKWRMISQMSKKTGIPLPTRLL
jgi:hypothetical protein